MKRAINRTLVSVCVIVFVVILVAGCNEQNLSDTKKARLVGAENIKLKKQLARCEGLLEKCRQEKKDAEERSKKELENIMTDMFEDGDDENAKLYEEIANLHAQIEQLKKELEESKKMPSVPDSPQPL